MSFEFKYERIGQDLINQQHKHINGIENFWNSAERILLRKYNGSPRHSFELFLSADNAWPRVRVPLQWE